MPVRTKRIYDPAEPDDGVRVLTTNYWPRGISRERAGTYVRALAPTRDLLRAFKDGAIAWPEYEVRYLNEMRGDKQRDEIARLAETARAATITLMCACREDAQCHRRLLRRLIEDEVEAVA